jgi:pimeloyl-ACP methyl ester carboxylesterase
MEAATRYARSGDVHVAYQVFGQGPDVVFLPGWVSHVEACWDFPPLARFLDRLASFCRVVHIDRRGTGLSDPLPAGVVPTLEQRIDDVRAVLDDAGIERAALLGVSEGGPLNILFAATYPERTTALVLFGTFARMTRAAGYPEGEPPERLAAFMEHVRGHWGTGVALGSLAPSLRDDTALRQAWGRYQRMAASPSMATALLALNNQVDVRHVLGAIHIPTLVLHRAGDRFVPSTLGRWIADHIQGARWVELPGADHFYVAGDVDALLDEIEEFLTGARSVSDASRVLATVMVTDIVGSTELATQLGDARWRGLLEQHDAFVRRQLARFRGREVKTTGDGFLATFDGPARALRCGAAIASGVAQLDLAVRVGVHSGECEMRGDDVAGMSVHIAARVAALAGPGEVLCTQTVKDLVVGSGLRFDARPACELRGVPGQWPLFAAS